MTREEAIKRFNGIINAMSISIAQSKFYPSKAELDELCDMAIEALHQKGVYDQTKWERDMALQTLKEHGIGLGQKYEPSTDAEEEALHKILERGMIELPQEYVSVVRCKDCKWYKKIVEKSKSGLCHYDLVARCLHDEDFCSHGERREP